MKNPKPYVVQMVSGKHGQHCDILPNQSLQQVEDHGDGLLKLVGRMDFIPPQFPFQVIKNPDEISKKDCPECKNTFPEITPFMGDTCIRCFERMHHVDRDTYREALRMELALEKTESKE